MAGNIFANSFIAPKGAFIAKTDIVPLTVRAFSGQTNNIFELYDPSGNLSCGFDSTGAAYFNSLSSLNSAWNIDASGNAEFVNLIIDSSVSFSDVTLFHLYGITGIPGIALTAGTGAGTGPTLSVAANSNDMAGQLSVTTGTLPAGTGSTIFTATFTNGFTHAPFVVFSPANANASTLSGVTMVFVTSTTTAFVFKSGTTALTAATQYVWNYHCLA